MGHFMIGSLDLAAETLGSVHGGEHEEDDVEEASSEFFKHENHAPVASGTVASWAKEGNDVGNGGFDGDGGTDGDGGMGGRRPASPRKGIGTMSLDCH